MFTLISFKGKSLNESEVFLSLNCKMKVPLYSNTSKLKVLKYLSHNFKEEDYLLFTIKNSNDSMYYVEASHAIAGGNVKGWINKSTKVAIFPKAYNEKLIVYNSFSKKSKKTSLSNISGELNVLDYKDGWLKVKATVNGKAIAGWLPPESQCSNPYTTCN